MRIDSSQGSLKALRRTLKIGGILAAPVVIALGLGFALGTSFQTQEDPQQKVEQVKIQAQMAADQLLAEINLLRLEAGVDPSSEASQLTGALSEQILLKAELTQEVDGKYRVKWKAQSTAWTPGRYFTADALIQSALVTGVAEKDKGVSVLPIRADRSGGSEWLCFIFRNDESAGGRLFLVLVDPAKYFKTLSNWHLHSGSGKYRSYLLGSSGIVLAHSQASLVGTDLNSLPLFAEIVKKVVGGVQRSGSERLASLDHQLVEMATLRVGTLPLAVVVESPHPALTSGNLRNAALFLGFFFLWGVLWYCASYLRRHLIEVVVHTLSAPISDEIKPRPSAEFFTGMDFLILSEGSPLTSSSATVKRSDEES